MDYYSDKQVDERFIVVFADAIVEPNAVVVEVGHALIAHGAVLCEFIYFHLAQTAEELSESLIISTNCMLFSCCLVVKDVNHY